MLFRSQNFATLTTGAGITNLNVALGTGNSTINANARTNLAKSQTLAALNIGDSGVVVLGAPLPGFSESGGGLPAPRFCSPGLRFHFAGADGSDSYHLS